MPSTRMTELTDRLEEVRSRDLSSCGSFTYAYHCMCDYHGVPFSEEVAWVSVWCILLLKFVQFKVILNFMLVSVILN